MPADVNHVNSRTCLTISVSQTSKFSDSNYYTENNAIRSKAHTEFPPLREFLFNHTQWSRQRKQIEFHQILTKQKVSFIPLTILIHQHSVVTSGLRLASILKEHYSIM